MPPRGLVPLLAVACIWAAALSSAGAQAVPNEQAIRRQRASSNAAIARHDTGGIGAIFADDVVVVTSNSVHAIGRATNLQRFSEQFRTRPDVVYVRTPQQVRVYDAWGMASEYGRWTGSWTDTDGKIRIGGIYFAKWRLRNGSWLVESETFVPERCSGGAYCKTLP
jgi:ketosteroid isomerase-like protein